MNVNTSFSIIVPVFNTREEFLLDALDSVNKINYDNYEVIVVNDGSNKETTDYLEELINRYNFVYHKFKTNKGATICRKKGISLAKNEYSIFFDSDDILDKESLNNLNKIINQNKSDVIIYPLPRFSNSIENIKINNEFFDEGNLTKDKVMEELLSLHINSICEKCAKTSLMKSATNNLDEKIIMGEDLQHATNLILNANSFYYTNKKIYYYRINGLQKNYYDYRNLNDLNFTIPTYRKVFIEHDEYDRFKRIFKLSSVNSIVYRAFRLCKYKNKKELLNQLNDTEITKITSSIDSSIPFANNFIYKLVINKHYFLLGILAKIYNKAVPEI